jgi:glycosyltransferase involved in cell wall biosynthesis
VRAALVADEEIALCPRENPLALAAAIRTLCADPAQRTHLSRAGQARFRADFTIEQLGARYKAHLLEQHLASRIPPQG